MEKTKDERERLWSERMEITVGGVEVHGRSVQRRGDRDPGIEIKYAPVFQGTGIHQWMENLSVWLSELCHETVMRMDDEPARDRLHQLLQAYDQVEIAGEAGDGEEAWLIILELCPDLVFLDIQMPVYSGLEVAASLLQDHGNRVSFRNLRIRSLVSALSK